MPRYPVSTPDGTVLTIDASSPDEALKKAQVQHAQSQLTPPAGKIPPQEGMGAGEQFLTGMGDPLSGGRQMYTHATGSPQAIADIDKQVGQREAGIQARGGGGLMRGLGAAATMAPLMAAGPLGGVAGSAAGGAIAGALQPTPPPTKPNEAESFWTQKVNDALIGAAMGAGFGAAGSTMAPSLTAEQRMLTGSGVKLTPGQMHPGTMGAMRRAEEAFKSVPLLGSFIRGAELRSRETFNTAFINQGLSNIGQKLDKKTPAGHAAIAEAAGKFGQAYDKTYAKVQNFFVDQDFARDMQMARKFSEELGEDKQKAFEAVIRNRLGPLLAHQGAIQGPPLLTPKGDLLRQADTALRSIASQNVAKEPAFAERIEDVRAAVLGAMIRQNPTNAQELSSLREGYALFARARKAATRDTTDGVFTPKQLLAAIQSKDQTVDHARFAKGDALGQEFAKAADHIIGSKMPDSGTPERQAFMRGAEWLSAGGAGAYGASHPDAIKYMIGAGAFSLPYTKPGMATLNALGTSGISRPIGQALRAGSAVADPIAYGGPQQ